MTDKGIVNVIPDVAPNLTKLVTFRNSGTGFCETFVDGVFRSLFSRSDSPSVKDKNWVWLSFCY